MLNRRHLRIKTFQTVYAFQQLEEKSAQSFEKSLLESILSVHKTYVHLLNLALELSEFEQIDTNERASKYLPTEADKNAKAFLCENLFLKSLQGNAEFTNLLKSYKVSWSGEEVLLRDLFTKLKATELFTHYQEQNYRTLQSDRDFITSLYKNLIFTDPLLEQYLEEKYINWVVDKSSVDGMILKSIRSFAKEGADIDILPITANWEEDKDFAISLLKETIKNDQEYDALISAKTENWELERIALVDVILMKMAIAELVSFPSIPTKVTMNEYIDISKEFSTPKSKGFINGILDKILIDLKASGKITKIGRGLME